MLKKIGDNNCNNKNDNNSNNSNGSWAKKDVKREEVEEEKNFEEYHVLNST